MTMLPEVTFDLDFDGRYVRLQADGHDLISLELGYGGWGELARVTVWKSTADQAESAPEVFVDVTAHLPRAVEHPHDYGYYEEN